METRSCKDFGVNKFIHHHSVCYPNVTAIGPTIDSRSLKLEFFIIFKNDITLFYISSPNLDTSLGRNNSHTFKFRELTVFLDASLVVRAVGRPVGAKVGFGYTVRPLRYHATVSSKPQLCAHPPHHSRKFYIRNPDSRVSKVEFHNELANIKKKFKQSNFTLFGRTHTWRQTVKFCVVYSVLHTIKLIKIFYLILCAVSVCRNILFM